MSVKSKEPTAPSPPQVIGAKRHPEKSNLLERKWQRGLVWALLSPVFLGTVPIFAKLAYAVGVSVTTVVVFRTVFAAAILWLGMFIFSRHLIRSSTPAVLSSLLAGAINGIGSLFFYASLTRIDASLGQLINISYLVFVTMFLRLAGQEISWLTLTRTGLTIGAIYLLTQGGHGNTDWIGAGMMLFAALTYAIQLVLSQRIMLDIPAPTMTLYAITAMAAVVIVAWLFNPSDLTLVPTAGWRAIFWMGLFTSFSRLTLFLGVKNLGSIQTALLGVFEVVITIVLAAVFLDETLSWVQWLGAVVLMFSIFLVKFEKNVPRAIDWWQYLWRLRVRK